MSGNSGSSNNPSHFSVGFQEMTFNFYRSAPSTINVYYTPVDPSMVQSQRGAEGRQESTPQHQAHQSQASAVVRLGPNTGVTGRPSPGSPFPAGPSTPAAAGSTKGLEDEKSSIDSESTPTPQSGFNFAFMSELD